MNDAVKQRARAIGRETVDVDLCVVGAGVVGLAHAHEGRRRGLRVALLEREQRAVGASVRNFGHAFFAGVSDGEDLECALRSRERWLELGARARLHMRTAGTLVVARSEDELEVIEGAAANPRRGIRMLTPIQAGELAPIATPGLLGAAHCTLDVRVDPRGAVAGLARLLEGDPGARVYWGACVEEVEPGAVHSAALSVRAPMTVICPGPDYTALPSSVRGGLARLTLCKLQMLRVAAPAGRRYEPALVTGLSMVRYPAFTAQPASERVRRRLLEERPDLLRHGIHLLVTQLPDGDLIIGDTHEYGETPEPFAAEQLDELLLAEARALLGVDALAVRERWIGIYPAAAGAHLAGGGDHFLVGAPLEGVRVVEVTSGLGMTMALGHAGAVLDELERGTSAAA